MNDKRSRRIRINSTIDEELLRLVDKHRRGTRSATIETALLVWLADKRATEMRRNFDARQPRKRSEDE